MINAKVILDSIGTHGIRLTTMELTFPRLILSEFNTHGLISKNSRSSRAVPLSKTLKEVTESPFIPRKFPKNQSGMQPSEYWDLGTEEYEKCKTIWLKARDNAVDAVISLNSKSLNIHKQIANRLIEPFMWHTVIASATDWQNFFALRCNDMAQLEIAEIAYLTRDLYNSSKPILRLENYSNEVNKWHLPYVQQDELNLDIEILKKISCARCARVSYLTHEGIRNIDKDLELFERLYNAIPKHSSAFAHVGMVSSQDTVSGNFRGWVQYRQIIPNHYTPG